MRRASISGRGLFKDGASDALLRQAFFDGAIPLCQIAIPDFGTIEEPFQIGSLEFSGDHNGEVSFDVSLESAGLLTFTSLREARMANKHRGEIDAEIGGRRRTLVLTLGALAELESAFGADDLVALAERFGSGRLSARDLIRVIAAGLRGAGESVGDDDVAAMTVAGGAAGFARIAADLLAATFSEPA